MSYEEMVGQVFGRWTVLEIFTKDVKYQDTTRKRYYGLCVCECGREKKVRLDGIKSGKSVGCSSCSTTKHGMSKSTEYRSWRGMLDRCYNKNHESYPHYGGRGIEVAKEWRKSFKKFLDCVGTKPFKDYSIDRIDVDGNYKPGNVRWASPRQQQNNRRCSVNPLDHCFEW